MNETRDCLLLDDIFPKFLVAFDEHPDEGCHERRVAIWQAKIKVAVHEAGEQIRTVVLICCPHIFFEDVIVFVQIGRVGDDGMVLLG